MIYAEKLKKLKEKNLLTQKDLASVLNIERGTYSSYEIEDSIMPLKHLNTICNYFDVSIDYIFGLSDIKKYPNSKSDIDKIDVGKRLREFRKERKLTQVRLAEILNTVHPTITNYENGKHLISTAFLYDICKKYNISADYLLGKIDEPKYLK